MKREHRTQDAEHMERARTRCGAASGAALIFVLVVVGVVSVAVLEFAFERQVEGSIARNHASDIKALYQAKAGAEFALGLVAADDVAVDGLEDLWALKLKALPVGDGWTTWDVADESGKLDLNRLVDGRSGEDDKRMMEVLERLMLLLELDNELIPALMDWLDADGDRRHRGAERTDYAGRWAAGRCKNGDLDSIDELVLVKGFETEMVETLRPFVTIYSGGKINVNTAPALLLQAMLPSMDEQAVKRVITARGDGAFRSTGEAIAVGELEGADRRAMLQMGTVRSSFFSVKATGQSGDSSRVVSVVAHRSESGKVEQVFWHIEK